MTTQTLLDRAIDKLRKMRDSTHVNAVTLRAMADDVLADLDRARAEEINVPSPIRTALELTAEECEDHPLYLGPGLSADDIATEGGDAAFVTEIAYRAREALSPPIVTESTAQEVGNG